MQSMNVYTAILLYFCSTRIMSNTGFLYIVPTPIGNLKDITQRAIEVLQSVAAIACEDTRHSRILLEHLGIQKPTFSLHDHNESQRITTVIERLESGDSLALISDAGTPLISDPGYKIVHACREARLNVVSLPGPCAAITALAGSGLPSDSFCFKGFVPVKQQAKRQLAETLLSESATSIFYEAPRRIVDTLSVFADVLPENQTIVVAKELSKTFETYRYGAARDVHTWFADDPLRQKGEFVIMVAPAQQQDTGISEEAQALMRTLLAHLPAKKAAAVVAEHYGLKKNALYQWSLTLDK